MDPSKTNMAYSLTRVAVPSRGVITPASPEVMQAALDADAKTFERLLAGYHLLDRN